MHGNVWEWSQDWFGDYPKENVTDPVGPESGAFRVGRGGGFISSAAVCRSADRYALQPSSRDSDLGLRPATDKKSLFQGQKASGLKARRTGDRMGCNSNRDGFYSESELIDALSTLIRYRDMVQQEMSGKSSRSGRRGKGPEGPSAEDAAVRMMERLDRDGDGYLSRDQIEFGLKMMRKRKGRN